MDSFTDRCGQFLSNWPILSYVELLQLQASSMGDLGYCFSWRLSSWAQTQPTYFAMVIHSCFQILCDWLSPCWQKKWARQRKSILLSSIFQTCNEKTTRDTSLWDLYRSGFINRACFETTRGQTLIKWNLLCVCVLVYMIYENTNVV